MNMLGQCMLDNARGLQISVDRYEHANFACQPVALSFSNPSADGHVSISVMLTDDEARALGELLIKKAARP